MLKTGPSITLSLDELEFSHLPLSLPVVLAKSALSWDKRHLSGHPAPWGLAVAPRGLERSQNSHSVLLETAYKAAYFGNLEFCCLNHFFLELLPS